MSFEQYRKIHASIASMPFDACACREIMACGVSTIPDLSNPSKFHVRSHQVPFGTWEGHTAKIDVLLGQRKTTHYNPPAFPQICNRPSMNLWS